LAWFAFLLVLIPLSLVLYVRVEDDASLIGTTQRVEVFALGEFVVLTLAFLTRKWLARWVRKILWLACVLVFIALVLWLVGYLFQNTK
jgi:hypothetical protein